MLLDEIIFERQGFFLVVHDDVIDVGDFAHQRAGLGVLPVRFQKVGAHAAAQRIALCRRRGFFRRRPGTGTRRAGWAIARLFRGVPWRRVTILHAGRLLLRVYWLVRRAAYNVHDSKRYLIAAGALMRRGVSQFVLLVLLGAALLVAASLSARCATGSRTSTTSKISRGSGPRNSRRTVRLRARGQIRILRKNRRRKRRRCPTIPRRRPLPRTLQRKPNPACCLRKTTSYGIRSTRSRILTWACSTCTRATWTRRSAGSKTPSACAPISPSRACYLAECYEKKGDPSEAVRYYKEYLQVLPNAPDAKKVQQKIEKLSKK